MSKNKIALVTGGSRGLGKDMSLKLAAKGIDVILTYNTKKDEAKQVVSDIKAMGRKSSALQLDSSQVSGFDAFSNNLIQTLQLEFETDKFDFLINNAGTALYTPFIETNEEQFDQIINIHFKGVYFLTQKLLGSMNDGGRIINLSSGLARFTLPGTSAYGPIKAAIDMFTKYLAKELGSRGIAANSVAPGAIATDFGGGRVRDNKDLNDHLSGLTALGRVGVAEDIGGIVAFLCTEDARWINGQRIEASGGIFL